MPQWQFIGKDGQQRTLPPVEFGENGAPVWYPFIPFGTFVAPTGEYFEVTPEHTADMIAHLKAGFPNALGIPGDENQLHQKNSNGAYAWAVDLENREDGLYALVKPTAEGLAHVDSLPYISPNFTVGAGESPNYPGRRNIMEAFAMCSSPWFYGQPGLTAPGAGARVMASMSTVGAAAPPDTKTDDTGGKTMPTPEELQEQLEAMVAEKATLEETITTLTTENEALKTDIAAKDERITALEAEQTAAKTAAEAMGERLTALESKLAENEHEAQVKAVVDGLEATVLEETDAAGATVQAKYTPDAVKVLAALQTDPGPEASAAFMAHIKEHGGKPQTVVVSEKEALQHIKASQVSGGDSNAALTDEQKLGNLPDADAARVRDIMQREGCGYEQAYRMDYNDRHMI